MCKNHGFDGLPWFAYIIYAMESLVGCLVHRRAIFSFPNRSLFSAVKVVDLELLHTL